MQSVAESSRFCEQHTRPHHFVKHIRYHFTGLWTSSRVLQTILSRLAVAGSDTGPTRIGIGPRLVIGCVPPWPISDGSCAASGVNGGCGQQGTRRGAAAAQRQPPRRCRDAPPPPGCGWPTGLAFPLPVSSPRGAGQTPPPPRACHSGGSQLAAAGAASAHHSAHRKEPRPRGSGRRGGGRGGCERGGSERRGRRRGRAEGPSRQVAVAAWRGRPASGDLRGGLVGGATAGEGGNGRRGGAG